MNILAISHEYPPIGGGGANAALHILNELVIRGHEVTLVTTACVNRNEIERELIICEVNSKRLRNDSCSFGEMLDYLLKGIKKSDKTVCDSIHCNKSYDIAFVFFGIPSGPIGYYLKKKYRLPYIIRFGGGDIPGFQNRFSMFYKFLAPEIKCIWKNADARIANSKGLRRMAYDFCDKYHFEIIANGVDTKKYIPSKERRIKGFINILFVSRLIERKGLQHVIPSLNYIEKKCGKGILLTVVGDGPYRETLERLSYEYGVSDKVIFEGEKRGDLLVKAYQNGDVFILPSSNEGMPNVVLEAMACGLPIIMTPCQGSTELIDGNGYIATIENFVDRIVEIILDDNMRRNMREISRLRAIELFSWKHTVDQYEKLMQSVCKVR